MALKYEGRQGWATIFGRLLFEFLWREDHQFSTDTIVLPNPTFIGDGSRSVLPHTERVIESAHAEDVLGAFDFAVDNPPIVQKTGPTPQSAAKGWRGKKDSADALPDVLRVTAPERLAGKRILIYDDVCTTGLQLNALAHYLRSYGADSVEAVVLARTPYRQSAYH